MIDTNSRQRDAMRIKYLKHPSIECCRKEFSIEDRTRNLVTYMRDDVTRNTNSNRCSCIRYCSFNITNTTRSRESQPFRD